MIAFLPQYDREKKETIYFFIFLTPCYFFKILQMSIVLRIKGLHFYLSSPPTNSAGQCLPSKQHESGDTWDEIDRRNEHVLHPINSKDSFKSHKTFFNLPASVK